MQFRKRTTQPGQKGFRRSFDSSIANVPLSYNAGVRGLCFLVLLVLHVSLFPSSVQAQSDDCPTEINGGLRGESGNVQDHMFHSLAIDPTNENVVYAGTETNGIFKTTDGGATWTRLRLGFKCTEQKTGYSQIFDIAIDPTSPQVLYASAVNGPGPSTPSLFPSASGGVYKSTDGGLTWTQKNLGFTNTYVTYVLVDSMNPNRLYAGVGGLKSTFGSQNAFYDGGIWVSNDAAESWSALTLPPGLNTNIFVDMVLRGSNQRIIYASAQSHGADAPIGYGLIRSTDGGRTWTIDNPTGQTISGFDVFNGDPSVIYGHDLSNGRRVHKSTDGGNTWTQLQAGFFGVVRIHPTNSQVMYITGRAGILKTSDGFLTQQEVYNDSDLPSTSQMVDIKISQTNPNIVWAAAKGYYLYTTSDAGRTWRKITTIRDMVYGNPRSQNLPIVVSTPAALTGIAVVNTGATSATVTLTSYENSGSPTPASPGQNPVSITVAPKSQVARLSTDLFGAGTVGAWVKVTADRPEIKGFFLTFDPALTTMDGVPFSSRPVKDVVIPELQNADIFLVNPSNSAAADVTLRLIGNEGAELTSATNLRIPPNGRYVSRARDLAPGVSITNSYLRVTSSEGLVITEQFGAIGQFTNVLNGLVADTGSRNPYSPQYVAGGGYKSALTLINLEDVQTNISITWIDNNGDPIGRNARFNLPARGRIVITDADLFGVSPPAQGLGGYLAIGSDTTRITGTVRFGDSAESQFQTTLPLVTSAFTETIYAQVAQDATYYTGLAILNRNSIAANVTISIFNSSGIQVGSGQRTIAPSARIAEVLTQIDPNLPSLSSGYFKITADRPVFSFGVFGTHSLSVLSAIPAQ